MILKIIAYAIGIIVAIPILLWLVIRGIFTGKPLSEDNREMTEEIVDLLFSSILKKAGDAV